MGNTASRAVASTVTKASSSNTATAAAATRAPPSTTPSSPTMTASSTSTPSNRSTNRNINIQGEPLARTSSETKDADILRDASDPSASSTSSIQDMLSKNLASLGQATIQQAQMHRSTRFTPNTASARVLQRRAELEESESSLSADPNAPATRNRITATNLTTLLDARKDVKTSAEFRKLCEDFNCDAAYVASLARFVNSPSLVLQRTKQQEKDDTYLARWAEPAPFQDRIAAS